MSRFAVRAGLFAATALFAACGAEEPEPVEEMPEPAPEAAAPAAPMAGNLPAGVTAQMVQDGQQIFTGNGICYTCHSQDGTGTALAPDLTDDQWLWITPGPNTYEEIVALVKAGVPQPKEHPAPMPPLGGAQLTEEQVRSVSAYVYSMAQ